MIQQVFPLTFKWEGGEGQWKAFCPEWQVAGHGSIKEAAKQGLCGVLLINARTILEVKDDHPTMEPQMVAVAQQVMDNKDRLPKLLQEAA